MKTFFFSALLRRGSRSFLRCLLLALLLPAGWLGASAQVPVNLLTGSTAYTTSAANTTINVGTTYSGNITINHATCTVNFLGVPTFTYNAQLTVNSGGAGSVINVNGNATVAGSSNVINAAVTINTNAAVLPVVAGRWTGNFYGGIASGSTVNNAGTWGGAGVQFKLPSPNSITINNSGTWNALAYDVNGPTTITNSGTWSQPLGNTNAALTLTNAAGATWNQPIASGSGSATLTNNGTWTGGLAFPSGTNSFSNRAGATATLPAVAFNGTTTVSNSSTGGAAATLTFSGSISPSASTAITNYVGTVNTSSSISNAGTVDNRATWNASTFASTGTVSNAGTLAASTSYANTSGNTTNSGTITTPAYTNTSGSTANNGTITASTSYTNSSGTTTNSSAATIATATYTNTAGTTTNSGTLNPTGNFIVGSSAGSTVVVNSAINPGGSYQNGGTTTNNGIIRPGTFYDNQNTSSVTTNNGSIRPGTYYLNQATTTNNTGGSITPGTYYETRNSGTTTSSGTINPASYYLSGGNTTNGGTITPGTYYTNVSGATTANSGSIRPGTDFTNQGNVTISSSGQIVLASASSTFSNQTSGSSVTNAGLVQTAGNFTNNGAFNGAGSAPTGHVKVAGVSSNSYYTFGASGLLDFCDSTPGAGPSSNKGFNVQTGAIASSVTACIAPLPVELTRFAATATAGRVELSWATASEKNSAYFVIERGTDGHEFAPIGTVAAQGSKASPTSYAFLDNQHISISDNQGITCYYRLRQVDQDGTVAFSPVVAVKPAPTVAGLRLFPIPVTDIVQLELPSGVELTGTVEVVSVSGRTVLTTPASHPLDLRALPAGAYVLRLRTTTGETLVQRLLKQ